MLSEIQISISEVGLSEKEWLLGSHCHDSEGTSNSRRNESLIIAKICFSLSLNMSLFFPIQMTRSPAQQEKACRKTQARGFIVSPHREIKVFRCFLDVGGEMQEEAPTIQL